MYSYHIVRNNQRCLWRERFSNKLTETVVPTFLRSFLLLFCRLWVCSWSVAVTPTSGVGTQRKASDHSQHSADNSRLHSGMHPVMLNANTFLLILSGYYSCCTLKPWHVTDISCTRRWGWLRYRMHLAQICYAQILTQLSYHTVCIFISLIQFRHVSPIINVY